MSRRKLDAYYTPDWAVRDLLRRVEVKGVVAEPCAGQLAISKAIETMGGLSTITNDIDPACPTDVHMDATKDMTDWYRYATWCVTNPPL